jgi:hypothetical protein
MHRFGDHLIQSTAPWLLKAWTRGIVGTGWDQEDDVFGVDLPGCDGILQGRSCKARWRDVW